MTEDSANKCYKLYVDMANINVSTDNTTELNYNKKLLREVISNIKKTCEHSYHNIPVDVMS